MATETIVDTGDRAAVVAVTGLPAPPERKNGRLTRKGMEQVIREGGSVQVRLPDPDIPGNFRTRLATRVEDLPSEAELAVGDADLTAQARQALLDQQKEIQRQLAMLGAAGSGGATTAPASASTTAPAPATQSIARDVRPEAETDAAKPAAAAAKK